MQSGSASAKLWNLRATAFPKKRITSVREEISPDILCRYPYMEEDSCPFCSILENFVSPHKIHIPTELISYDQPRKSRCFT